MKSTKEKGVDWREEISEVSIALEMPGSPVLTTVKERAAEVMAELHRLRGASKTKELETELAELRKFHFDLVGLVGANDCNARERDKMLETDLREDAEQIASLQQKVERLEETVLQHLKKHMGGHYGTRDSDEEWHDVDLLTQHRELSERFSQQMRLVWQRIHDLESPNPTQDKREIVRKAREVVESARRSLYKIQYESLTMCEEERHAKAIREALSIAEEYIGGEG